MSISSCPQCAKQITLPTGISGSAKVRCPICRAQYTLAEAIVNMPPLLEVIEDTPATGDWLHPLSENGLDQDAGLAVPLHASSEASAAEDAVSDELDLGEEVVEHDDFLMQDQDTEIEELGFSASDPLLGEAPIEVEPLHISEPDEESVLDFTKAREAKAEADAAAESEVDLEFDEITSFEEPSEEEVALDFAEPELAAAGTSDEVPFELDDLDAPPAAHSLSSSEAEEIDLDFGEEMAPVGENSAADELPIEFGEETFAEEPVAVHSGEEEIALDFGEPAAESAAAPSEPAAEETGKKGKKQKAKKEKKPREPKVASEKGRRNLVGTLATLLLGAVLALSLTIYGMLWLGPAFDIFNLAPKLPTVMVPPSLSKSSRAKIVAQAPLPTTPPPSVPQPMPEATPPATPAALPPANEVPESTPAAETPAAETPSSAPESPAPETPAPTEPVASETPAEPVAEDKSEPAKTEPAADPVDNLLDEPAKPDADSPAETPVEPSAETPAKPELPEEMPAEELPDAKATDSPAEIADDAAADLVSPDKPVAEPTADEPALPEPPSVEESPVHDAKQFTLPDLVAAAQAAEAAHQKMVASSEAELKKTRSQFYLSLYHLAEVVTFVRDDPASPALSEQQKLIEPIVEQFVGDSKRLDAIKYNAGRWLSYTKRTTPGIMLAGTVQEVEQAGKLYQIKLGIGLESDAPIVAVVQSKDPQLAPGDQAYVLGSIVADPTENLAGYEGDEREVVWSGMTLKLPATK